MGAETKIQWANETFNCWRGCTKISTGCKNCYASVGAGRNRKVLGVWGPNGTRVLAAESYWKQPLAWDRKAAKAGERHRVFCASYADVFEDWPGPVHDHRGQQVFRYRKPQEAETGQPGQVNRWWTTYPVGPDGGMLDLLTLDEVRRRLFTLIARTPHLDYLLLTKRPEYMRAFLARLSFDRTDDNQVYARLDRSGTWDEEPLKNVWLGVSVEDQTRADERIPLMLDTPAAVRFLSVEPMLGPIEFSNATRRADAVSQLGKKALDGIDWVIGGGESGDGARPCKVEWLRSVVRQCQAVQVPVFVKQLGSNPEGDEFPEVETDPATGTRELHVRQSLTITDPKGGAIEEFPDDLKVREFPRVS